MEHCMITIRPPAGSYDTENIFYALSDALVIWGRVIGVEEDSQKKKKYDHCHVICDMTSFPKKITHGTFREDHLNPLLRSINFPKFSDKCAIHVSWKKDDEDIYGGIGYMLKDILSELDFTGNIIGIMPDCDPALVMSDDWSFTTEQIAKIAATAFQHSKKEKSGLTSPMKWACVAVELFPIDKNILRKALYGSETCNDRDPFKFNVPFIFMIEVYDKMSENGYVCSSNCEMLFRLYYQKSLNINRSNEPVPTPQLEPA